jgi:hypothetical protein
MFQPGFNLQSRAIAAKPSCQGVQLLTVETLKVVVSFKLLRFAFKTAVYWLIKPMQKQK